MIRTRKFAGPFLAVALATVTLLFSGCGGGPSDQQVTANVQKQISADAALHGQPVSVAANHGTVTLSGTVDGPGSRELAANDAAKVSGVHKVINNLTVAAPAASAAANPPEAPPAPTPSATPEPTEAPAEPATIVIPAGTRLRVRLRETLSSNHSRTGERFSGILVSPVRASGRIVIRAGARTHGTVIEAKSMGRFKGHAALALRLETVRDQGRTYSVRTSRIERIEQGKGKRSAAMTGGGAGLGAIIGGLAGGGKGALIGGLVGGGGGAAGSALTGNKDIVLPAETVLTFDLERSLTVRR